MNLIYRIVNVFAVDGARLSGNPLAVFEDGRGLDERTMQALARQMNLSETTFVLPSGAPRATARVRIFTPTFEMPFAGHPTLGTAHVVRQLRAAGERLVLEMAVGLVEVQAQPSAVGDGRWMLRAARAPETRPPDATRAELGAMLGLDEAVVGRALWVDTGAEQLVIPLSRPEEVRRAQPVAELLERAGRSDRARESMAYVWARRPDGAIEARFFFLVNGGVVEDPATGSACANLGGWLIATGAPLPARAEVRQGEAVGRPSRLSLAVDEQRQIFVSGEVVELGRGTFTL
jgi:PhzF family phenazine biosynthesis protein